MDPVHHAFYAFIHRQLRSRHVAGLVEQARCATLSHGITTARRAGDAGKRGDLRLTDEQENLPIVIHQIARRSGSLSAELPPGGAFMEDDVSDRLRGGIVKKFYGPVWPCRHDNLSRGRINRAGGRALLLTGRGRPPRARRCVPRTASRIHCIGKVRPTRRNP